MIATAAAGKSFTLQPDGGIPSRLESAAWRQSFMGHRKAESTAIYIRSAASQHDDARRVLSR
jgi:hypothetical protein